MLALNVLRTRVDVFRVEGLCVLRPFDSNAERKNGQHSTDRRAAALVDHVCIPSR